MHRVVAAPAPLHAGRLVAGLLVAGLLLAACGSGVPPKDWAGRVCAAVTPWRGEITDLNARAQQEMSGATTPEQARDSLLALLAGGETASEKARAAVVAAGVPDVDGGSDVAARFADALTRVRDAYRTARTDLFALPTTDAKAFYDGVVAVLARLQSDYAASGIQTSDVDAPELREAFDGVDQCR